MNKNPVENLLREPTESFSALCMLFAALFIALRYEFLFLSATTALLFSSGLVFFASIRAYQAYRVVRYQKRIKQMPYYALSTKAVPLSKKSLFVGRGFRWLPRHTQRLHQLKQVKNEKYLQMGRLHRTIHRYISSKPGGVIASLFNNQHYLNPFKPLPPVGGKPYLHGLGDCDKPVYVPQDARVGHTFVAGTTRVGKTRLASILINQDIRNGDAVIVVDPKGDLELMQDMYSACLVSNRLEDFKVVHLGFPELSMRYNPLKDYGNLTEVATRVVAGINASGEGQQFADFAWKYTDITANALFALGIQINYKNISFYLNRLEVLFQTYCDKFMPSMDQGYLEGVAEIKNQHDSRVDKNGEPVVPMEREKAVLKYMKNFIAERSKAQATDEIQQLVTLYDAATMDKSYFDKITASVGPVLAKINSSSARDIISFDETTTESMSLLEVIKRKKVIYIGLDSLSNFEVAQSVGKAFLADLVSTAGKIYKEPGETKYKLNIHVDELSEVIQDSFVKILNKAGGAGFQVTAYAQTKQDLEVALGSTARAEMANGNFNTLIMLRVKNAETAKLLTDVLPKVDVISQTQVSMVNDTPHAKDGVYFNTTNEDRVNTTSIPMIDVDDITDLPKGQAFVLVNGGELNKVRIPLPENEGLAPKTVEALMLAVNGEPPKDDNELWAKNKPDSHDLTLAKEVQESGSQTVHKTAPLIQDYENPNSESKELSLKVSETEPEIDSQYESLISWVVSRIESGNRRYSLEEQDLLKTSAIPEFKHYIFLTKEALIKYQMRSGNPVEEIKEVINRNTPKNQLFYLDNDGDSPLYPVKPTTEFTTDNSSIITIKEVL